jgi:hypothetical protein
MEHLPQNHNNNLQNYINIQTLEDRKLAFEQYKMLADSLNNINQVRETSNNFWITVNSLLISSIAYLRGFESVTQKQYTLLIWSVFALGCCLCGSWIRSLSSIKASIDMFNRLLIELEKHLPAKIFTISLRILQRLENKGSLTLKEMLVPYLFLLGYIILAIILVWFPYTLLKTS